MAENGEYAVDPDTGLKALKSKKDPKALEKIQALADKLFADGGEEKTVQEGSEILNELKMYTFQTLLELGTLDRVEKAAYVKFSEVAKELRNSVVVPEEKWLHLKEDIEKGYLNLSKLKKGMINAKNEASKEEVGDFDIMLEFIEEVLLGFGALRKEISDERKRPRELDEGTAD